MCKANDKNILSNLVFNTIVSAFILATGFACANKEHDPIPLRLYVVTDAHVGRFDSGDNMMAFAKMANKNEPNVVLDLGDVIQAEITDLYDYDTHKEASYHHVGAYEYINNVLVENNVEIPAIYLHGHNHGPDTLVRDAWGLEENSYDFPSFLVTDLTDEGIGAKFELYPDGQYKKFRIDVNNQTISAPVMHYQTRVENE